MINLAERDRVWVNRPSGEGGRKTERLRLGEGETDWWRRTKTKRSAVTLDGKLEMEGEIG